MEMVGPARIMEGGKVHWPLAARSDLESGTSLVWSRLWKHSGMVLATLDGAVVVASFLLSYYMRFHAQTFSLRKVPVADPMPYLNGAILLGSLWVLFIWREKGYDAGLKNVGVPALGLPPVVSGGFYAVFVLMAISFMFHILLSRQVYLTTALLGVVGMLAVRVLWRQVVEDCARVGGLVERILIVGTAEGVQEVAGRLEALSRVVRIVGWVGRAHPESRPREGRARYPFLGGLGEIRGIFAATPFDSVVISPSLRAEESTEFRSKIMDLVNFCEEAGISLFAMPDSFDVSVKQREVAVLSNVPLIRLQDASLDPLYSVVKRVIDIIVAACMIVAGLPLWVSIALAIKIESRGPILFVQTRAGRHGRPFKMYKFRTMVADAERRLGELIDFNALDEPVFKIRNDPRVTRIGGILRRSGLDEVPQLINVLKGEMSIVGPRPEEVTLVERYTEWQRRRLKAKPGITGLQQIRNRGEPFLAERVKHDLVYLKHQGFFLDLYILIKTIGVVVWGKGISR